MTKIAFVADLHADDLGSAMNPVTGLNRRFEDAIGILRWVAADANERGCEVLILGGDFTEQRHPAPWRVAMIADALRAFHGDHVLVRGNHDGLRAGRSIVDVLAPMLDHGSAFSRPGVEYIGGLVGEGTAVCCVPYLDRSWLRAASPEFANAADGDVYRALGEQFLTVARGLYAAAQVGAKPVRPTILVVHQGLAGGQMTDAQAAFLGGLSLVVDTAALAAIGFDAILAGHFHMHQVLRTDPLVVYAGSPHRVSFQEESQPKGYVVVDTETLPAFEFVETPARRFVTLRWSNTGARDYLGTDDLPFEVDPLAAVEGAVVRVLDIPPEADTASIRRRLEALGAFEVGELRARPRLAVAPSHGLAEGQRPADALAEYFRDDADQYELVDRGKQLLAEVAA